MQRHCLGHENLTDGSHVDCDNEPLTPSARKCDRCQMMDGVFASNVHQAHRNGREQTDRRFAANLERPHRLYFAAFRDGSVKVGITAAVRGDDRLVEQGAWAARFIADFETGYDVRDVEDRLSIELDLAQSVTTGRKLKGLISPVGDAELTARLDRLLEQAAPTLESCRSGLTPLDEPWRFTSADDPLWNGVLAYPIPLTRGRHDLRVKGTCGQVIAFGSAATDDTFVADLSTLFGTEIEPGQFGNEELRIQDSLF